MSIAKWSVDKILHLFRKDDGTLFEKLSPEVILMIFDQLDFADLLTVAQVDERLSVLAMRCLRA